MIQSSLRARYVSDSVGTASPARLVVMLYDRLVLDLMQAEEALKAGDRTVASGRLQHAQEILIELRTTLRTDVWEAAAGLAGLYTFVINELIAANVHADGERTAACRALLEPLRDAWREAAATTSAANAAQAG